MADYVKFTLATKGCFTLTPSLLVILCEYRYTLETRFLGLYIDLQWALKASKFGEITQTIRPFRCSRSLKVPIESPYGLLLLVIDNNLSPILHRF